MDYALSLGSTQAEVNIVESQSVPVKVESGYSVDHSRAVKFCHHCDNTIQLYNTTLFSVELYRTFTSDSSVK